MSFAVSVVIRAPEQADEAAFLQAARHSRHFHRPWVVAPQSLEQFQSYLQRSRLPDNRFFLIWRSDGADLLGAIHLTNIVLGAFKSGYLGYYAFAGHERQGYMTAGLKSVVRHAFTELKLHRLEANIQPANTASVALVRRCGFSLEGYSPRYLKIGGQWRDHERWAILAS